MLEKVKIKATVHSSEREKRVEYDLVEPIQSSRSLNKIPSSMNENGG
jgi:hypothetical protein